MKPARLTMCWRTVGPQLAVGHFLKTARGRVAYEITGMRAVKAKLKMLGRKKWIVTCARWEPKEVPEGATMHQFVWNRR